nr:hypothetical protein [uncultured Prevotella sp.]
MKLKTFFGTILGVVAIGLASCSSDLTNGENTPVNPNETARRSLSLSTENAKTRSEVNLTTGNKWVSGDKFLTYNVTFTGLPTESRTDILTASGENTKIQLRGHVSCKNNDKLAVFYPGMYSTGFEQYESPVVMDKSRITEKGQDGTEDNLKDFDYSFGTATLTVDGNSASGSVDMKKLYAVLKLDFNFKGDKLHNIKKVVLSNVIREKLFDLTIGDSKNPEVGSIEVNTPSNKSLDEVYVVVFPQNDFKPKFDVTTADNKTYTYSVTSSGVNIEAAKVYPITLQVKEYIPNPPYIEIGDVKWGKYNLQYTPGKKTDGWEDGYHLAANPWDYFYPDNNMPKINGSVDPDAIKFDRFRWGDISKAHNYANANSTHYSKSTTGISEKILDSNSEFGDLAYYASKHNWRLPTMNDFKKLMANTTQYAGYIEVDGHKIYGSLFIPDGVAHGYAVPNGVTVKKNASGVITNKGQLKESGKGGMKLPESQLYAFTKERINEGIFFPAAGSVGAYNDGDPKLIYPGLRGTYWTADPHLHTDKNKKDTQAYSFVFGMLGSQYSLSTVGNPTVGNDYPTKRDMYSIRPIYIGQ